MHLKFCNACKHFKVRLSAAKGLCVGISKRKCHWIRKPFQSYVTFLTDHITLEYEIWSILNRTLKKNLTFYSLLLSLANIFSVNWETTLNILNNLKIIKNNIKVHRRAASESKYVLGKVLAFQHFFGAFIKR